jgi:hypothetical protein
MMLVVSPCPESGESVTAISSAHSERIMVMFKGGISPPIMANFVLVVSARGISRVRSYEYV